MDYSLLKAEIAKPEYGQLTLTPEELAFAPTQEERDAGARQRTIEDVIAGAINAKTVAVAQPLPLASLQAFLDSQTVAAGPAAGVALSLAIEDLAGTAPGGAVALPLIYAARMLRRIDVAKYPAIEVANQGKLQALAEAMVAAGIMTADQVAALIALFPSATVPLYTALGFDRTIDQNDIALAKGN